MRKLFLLAFLFMIVALARAQYNVDKLIRVGRNALYYEDYVLSIQLFNRAIASKPYLYEPWLGRAEAKFRLEDYVGAESDCTESINLNPYVPVSFELRGLCRIRQGNFSGAISDYDKTISFEPDNKSLWYNRVLCRIENKDYGKASDELDYMMKRWPKFSQSFAVKAELCLQEKDTVNGISYLDKSIELNPYDGEVWATRAMISLSQSKWRDADQQLSKAIHFKPSAAGYYVNRALARYNINNLRGALADYDKAIELEPNNFLAHYNRGQLRVQVGDDNRAVDDFDFIVRLEPGNVMAIYNRALLRERIGNVRGAVADYTTLISQFPNFWVGLSNRARCYRKIGMSAKAEMDEFRIYKAQVNKSNGYQPRWSQRKVREVRKRSEINFDKYNQLVVDDKTEVEHEYENAYRGKVQNRKVDVELLPMYQLSYLPYASGIKTFVAVDDNVDSFNKQNSESGDPDLLHAMLYVNCTTPGLGEESAKRYLDMADSLTACLQHAKAVDTSLLLRRAVANSVVQDYYDAESDLTACIQEDSTFVLAFWQRGVAYAKCAELEHADPSARAINIRKSIDDFTRAIFLDADNAWLYYNRATAYAILKEYKLAESDYDHAIALDSRMPEAYYNRGLTRVYQGDIGQGVKDLSRAGELGLVDAYSAIKKYRDGRRQPKR